MASLLKVLILLFFFFFFFFFFSSFFLLSSSSSETETQLQARQFLSRRRLLLSDNDQPKKKATTTTSSILSSFKNQTKSLKPKPILSLKNQTKLTTTGSSITSNKSNLSAKNSTTKLISKPTNSTKLVSKFDLKKLNSTSKSTPTNSTKKPTSFLSKKSSDLLPKPTSPKNKTTKPTSTNPVQEKMLNKKSPSSIDQDDGDEDFVAEFRDLPTKFQKTLIPDLEKFSVTSKAYIFQANKQMTKKFKPIVGNKYASTIASVSSIAFILIPLILVSLICNRIKAYFSLQRLLIFIQAYLSIYFSILSLSSLVTGLEPLKFFYATSQSSYVCLQLLQTLGYVLYLLLLLMFLILVFSTESGLGSKILGLGQTFVGFAVGLHYYMSVFHRMVLHQPPKTNWKVHGIYATCFLVICLFSGADRKKKSYLEEGGEEGKKS